MHCYFYDTILLCKYMIFYTDIDIFILACIYIFKKDYVHIFKVQNILPIILYFIALKIISE